jgi:hypothetical protein
MCCYFCYLLAVAFLDLGKHGLQHNEEAQQDRCALKRKSGCILLQPLFY